MCVEVSKLLLSKISTNVKSNIKCKCKVKYMKGVNYILWTAQ